MTVVNPYFYGKVLLFGEYLVISGSKALTVPYRNVRARLLFPVDQEHRGTMDPGQSNRELFKYLDYLVQVDKQLRFDTGMDLDRFSMDLEKGLYMESDIPLGYGVGSSGALVAAVYDRYMIKAGDRMNTEEGTIPGLKKKFSKFESYFHGSSSGLDPLAIFLDTPLLIRGSGRITREGFKSVPGDIHTFLLDAGQTGNTGPLVLKYKEWCKESSYESRIRNEMIPLNEKMISDFLKGRSAGLYEKLGPYSGLQLSLFSDMIPGKLIPLWQSGLDSGEYYMKLCGSGGGGYFILFSRDIEAPNRIAKQYQLEKITIED